MGSQMNCNGLILIFASLLFAFVAGCSRSAPHVLVIIPDGYEGEFSIEKNVDGVDPAFHEGKIVYQIPKTGKLLTKDISPLFIWHTDSFMYKGGTTVNVKSLGSTGGRRGNEVSSAFDGTIFRWQVLK
jgi:hypothetical protein